MLILYNVIMLSIGFVVLAVSFYLLTRKGNKH